MPDSAHPQLYQITVEGTPSLNGQQCQSCGWVSFPHQSFGCERCGENGKPIVSRPLTPTGVLHSSATARLNKKTVLLGEIKLDDGPWIRARLKGDPQETIPGMRVQGTFIASEEGEHLEICFAVSNDKTKEPA